MIATPAAALPASLPQKYEARATGREKMTRVVVAHHAQVADHDRQQRADQRHVDDHVVEQRQMRLAGERVGRRLLAGGGQRPDRLVVDRDDRPVARPADEARDGRHRQQHAQHQHEGLTSRQREDVLAGDGRGRAHRSSRRT
jgi:hypothetical protein